MSTHPTPRRSTGTRVKIGDDDPTLTGHAGLLLTGDLLKGSASEKPGAAGLLRRALRALPQGHGPVSLRVDSGFFTVELLEACRRQRIEFCVSVARTEAMWTRLYAKLNT